MNTIEELRRWIKDVRKIKVMIDNKYFQITNIQYRNKVALITVKWFGPAPGINGGTWNTSVWNSNSLNNLGKQVIDTIIKQLHEQHGQQTLI